MFQIISPNMLKTYELCPKKFYLRYVKNISMPVNDDIFEFGKNIHALASYYLKGENIDKMEASLTPKEREVWDYLKSSAYFSYTAVNTEYQLSVKIGGYFFGGRLDALMKKDDTYYILDYKTGAVPKNPERDYQTMIYILAVKEFFNTDNINFIYIDLKNKKDLKIVFTPELKTEYTDNLIETAGKIEKISGNLPRRKDCKCEYSCICY